MATESVCIVGGGIIGLINAWYLNEAGCDVTVIDEGKIEDNASFGNAGLISPFEKEPLSHPGIVLSTLSLMLRGRSPLSLHSKIDPMIFRWVWSFVQSASHERLKRSLALFERYGRIAIEGYEELREAGLEFDYHRDGLLLIYTEEKSYASKLALVGDSPNYKILDRSEISSYLPILRADRVTGALLLRRNAHLDPGRLMHSLKEALTSRGVHFVFDEKISRFETRGRQSEAAHSDKGRHAADSFILATGADSSLARSLGRRLLMIPAKGYSVTFQTDEALKPATSSLFADLFIAMTPRQDDLRLTGKLQLGSPDHRPDPKRIENILETFRDYAVDFPMHNPKYWAGNRPLTPNDMPLIGRDEAYRNLIYATGLGWLGITFAPAIGRILQRLITEDLDNRDDEDILLFSGFYQGC